MANSRLTFSYEALGEFLKSETMEEDMRVIAEDAMEYAIADAPEGNPRTDPHSGRYKRSFSVETSREGTRARASLVNSSEESAAIEWGNVNTQARGTMMGAMRRAAS
jgi:hypothetical protein